VDAHSKQGSPETPSFAKESSISAMRQQTLGNRDFKDRPQTRAIASHGLAVVLRQTPLARSVVRYLPGIFRRRLARRPTSLQTHKICGSGLSSI
jgi:hypothetical protein